MTAILETAKNVYVDGPVGTPSEPAKHEIISLFGVIDGALTSVVDGTVIGGAVAYSTRALLYADLAHAAGKLGVVYNDATAAYNGVYVKSGSSGSGSWAITNLALPSTFAAELAAVVASNAGKLDASLAALTTLTSTATAITDLVDGDGFLIRDSAASFIIRRFSYAAFKNTLRTYFDTVYPRAAAAEKSTPVDGDLWGYFDSAASSAPRRITWASVKAALKAYFDTQYRNNTMATSRILGRATADSGAIEELTGAQVRTLASVFSTTEISAAERVGFLVSLTNVAGTGQAATADVPAAATTAGYGLSVGAPLIVKWPGANTGAAPTLELTDGATTYTVTLTGPGGRALVAGEMKANGYYIISITSAVGTAANGRVTGSVAVSDVAGLAAELDAKRSNTMATSRILGRASSGSGAIEELTGAAAREIMAVYSTTQHSAASRVSSLVTLTNIGGTGQNVTADIPDALLSTGYGLSTSANLRISWPSANTGPNPTLTVADGTGTYTMTLTGPGGRTIQAGELRAAGRYTVQFIASTGFNALGRVIEPLVPADIFGLVDLIDERASADEVAAIDQVVSGQEIARPGDAPWAWSSAVSGLTDERTPLSSPSIVNTAEGRVVRLTGPQTIAPRAVYALDDTRRYEIRANYRRPQNVADPAGASVRLILSWLNAAGVLIGNTTVSTETPTVSAGRRTVSVVIGATVAGDVEFAWPSGATGCTPYIQTYQADSVTDIEAIHWTDITDLGGYSPDLTALTAAVDSLVSEDLPNRTAALETAVTAPKVSRYETRSEAEAATVPATTEVIEVQRYTLDGPVCTTRYTRDVSASTGGFQSDDGAYWRLAEPVTRLEMFDAAGDGVTDDQAAWASAKSVGRPIWLDREYLVTDPSNPLGIPLLGPGRIITAVTGGFVQQNSKHDTGPVYFRSHLWRAKDIAMSGTPLKVVIMGDSTATNGYGVNLQTFVADELRNMGVAVSEVLSEAVSGHSWGTQNLATVLTGLGNQKQLAIIKFGINDAGGSGTSLESALSSMRNAMRQRLGEIRASTYGGYDELSILLIMPNVLGNNALNANNRNNLWLEMIDGCYIEAAKDFQCGLYNPYQESRNAVDGEGRWIDANGVHPEENLNDDIWGRALRETMALHGGYQRNRFVNQAFTEGVAPAATAALTDYPLGESWLRAQSADGWPFGGLLRTERHVDAVAKQTLYAFNQGHSQVKTRNWFTSSNIWSTWSGEAVALTLQNSWVAYGGLLGAPSVRRTSEGLICLSGVMKDGTTTTTTALFQLPAGYRPSANQYVDAVRYDGGGPTMLYIQTNGNVEILRNADATFLGLDGISFVAAA